MKISTVDTILREKLAVELVEKWNACYGTSIQASQITFQKTNKGFKGDFSINVFPFVKACSTTPDKLAAQTGEFLKEIFNGQTDYEVVKGFVNFWFSDAFWFDLFKPQQGNKQFALDAFSPTGQTIMVEYPSPNTNKPLHLGHLRNIFLGSSLLKILKAYGHEVVATCLYNDRGTNISKSMLAWQMFGNGATPASAGQKGDHFVGDYYVKFSNAYKDEISALKAKGLSEEEAEKQSVLNRKVNELTIKWEQGDAEVRQLWETMNGWVYEGFKQTYDLLDLHFDKFYYESDVYNLGKETVQQGLDRGIFYQKDDGSVWIDLTADGLDHKLVLRSNGTSVYITQDIATANQKEKDFRIDHSIYVVGNEQEYHFKVLFLILKKLGLSYADHLFHLSYGMVELPEGKMKSREGTVVDADDLIAEMVNTARATTEELGKVDDFSAEEASRLFHMLGMGALRYFILKVDPKKKMIFNPKESIDFNGHTGPFIQYTHARIRSVLRKAKNEEINWAGDNIPTVMEEKERDLLRLIFELPAVISEAAVKYNPGLIANFVYELAREYNQFYHDLPILKEQDEKVKKFRLALSELCGIAVSSSMGLLCIEVPERM